MTLVDSNILLDVFGGNQVWTVWSKRQMERAALNGPLVINDVIYAEVSVRFADYDILDSALKDMPINILPMPRAALFLAGKAFLRYRGSGGKRSSILSDFFIGAQAAVQNLPVLTRDTGRYRTYFPTVQLIAPKK